jgi:hypothetical protein
MRSGREGMHVITFGPSRAVPIETPHRGGFRRRWSSELDDPLPIPSPPPHPLGAHFNVSCYSDTKWFPRSQVMEDEREEEHSHHPRRMFSLEIGVTMGRWELNRRMTLTTI